MNNSSKHQNDVKGRNIKSQHMNLLRHGSAWLIFICWQPNESQQTKM